MPRRLAERVGETYVLWQAKVAEAMRAHLRGDLDRSQHEAEAAFALGAEGVPEAMASYAGQLTVIQRAAGKWSDLSEMAELMAATAAQNPGLPVLRGSLARTYCDLGRDDEAHSVIDEDIADGFSQFEYNGTWMGGMAALCEICSHLGREVWGSPPLRMAVALERPSVNGQCHDAGPCRFSSRHHGGATRQGRGCQRTLR